VVNQAKRDKLNEVVSIRRRIADIRQNLLVSIQSEIRAKTQLLADLDKQLQDVRSKLERGTLEKAVDFNRNALQLAARAFHEARKHAAEARGAYSRLKANLAVWKKDDGAAKVIAEEDHQATEKEKVASVQFQGAKHEEVRSGDKEKGARDKDDEGLRRQLVSVRPTLEAPLWRMLPNGLWYVYRGKLGDKRQRWLKGTLLTSGPIVAHAARISIAPSPTNGSLIMVAHLHDLKLQNDAHPSLDIDGAKFDMSTDPDGNFMFLQSSEAESRAILLMKQRRNIALLITSRDGRKYRFTSTLTDFSEAVRLITKECKVEANPTAPSAANNRIRAK
jgi:hypothetical protein